MQRQQQLPSIYSSSTYCSGAYLNILLLNSVPLVTKRVI